MAPFLIDMASLLLDLGRIQFGKEKSKFPGKVSIKKCTINSLSSTVILPSNEDSDFLAINTKLRLAKV